MSDTGKPRDEPIHTQEAADIEAEPARVSDPKTGEDRDPLTTSATAAHTTSTADSGAQP